MAWAKWLTREELTKKAYKTAAYSLAMLSFLFLVRHEVGDLYGEELREGDLIFAFLLRCMCYATALFTAFVYAYCQCRVWYFDTVDTERWMGAMQITVCSSWLGYALPAFFIAFVWSFVVLHFFSELGEHDQHDNDGDGYYGLADALRDEAHHVWLLDHGKDRDHLLERVGLAFMCLYYLNCCSHIAKDICPPRMLRRMWEYPIKVH